MKPEVRFFEKQRFSLRRIRIALATPPCVMLGLLIWQVVLGHTWGKQPMSNANVVGWTIFLWIVYFRLVTVKLVTEVRDGELLVGLRGLWRTRHVPLRDIASVETLALDPSRDYGGFGTAYVAGSTRAVRLKLKNGARLILGSQKPEELAALLRK
jgi:hypothetical protein